MKYIGNWRHRVGIYDWLKDNKIRQGLGGAQPASDMSRRMLPGYRLNQPPCSTKSFAINPRLLGAVCKGPLHLEKPDRIINDRIEVPSIYGKFGRDANLVFQESACALVVQLDSVCSASNIRTTSRYCRVVVRVEQPEHEFVYTQYTRDVLRQSCSIATIMLRIGVDA